MFTWYLTQDKHESQFAQFNTSQDDKTKDCSNWTYESLYLSRTYVVKWSFRQDKHEFKSLASDLVDWKYMNLNSNSELTNNPKCSISWHEIWTYRIVPGVVLRICPFIFVHPFLFRSIELGEFHLTRSI